MIFNVNQTEFINENQRIIWQFGTHIVPLEVSLADNEDEEILEGCKQIYDCTMEILTDIYNNPDKYIYLPRWYTCDYIAWLVNGNKPMKKHNDEFLRYLERIPRFGFSYDTYLDRWTNDKYPLFGEYFSRFGVLAKERKQNMGGYLDRRDFRLFSKRIILTLDDLIRPLSDKERAYCLDLHEYAILKGMKVEMKDPCFFRYIYKNLYSVEILNNPFNIRVIYRLDNGKHIYDQLEKFLMVVDNQTDKNELYSYIQGGICVCNACNGIKKANERCGRWVDIKGARRLSSMCHPAIGKYRRGTHNTTYTDEDIKMFKRMIDIRIEQIDKFIWEKK